MRPLLCFFAAASLAAGTPGWWMREPIRWVQTNIRETDAATDPRQLVDELTRFKANVLLLNMGGIVAFYPTAVDYHYPSPHMPPGRDFFGDTLRLAHHRGIRVVGRFDLSKTPKPVFDAHPEWFMRRSDGQPVVFNGLYSACINGGWYRGHALRILTEALERYPVDGLFFNMFGNQMYDYAGKYVGPCHCGSCSRKYREATGKPIPAEPDDDYRRFLFSASREVAREIGALIRSKRPEAGYFNYMTEHTDGIMSESNTAVRRPLPLWPYSASDNVNRARNSEPGKMAINLCMQFVDFPWRFATVPEHEIRLRLWQNLAHGGALAFSMNGTFDQQDTQAREAARPVFAWAAEHPDLYAAQQSAARVLLLGAPQRTGQSYNQNSYRGFFRLLSERHIPFAVADNLDWLGRREYDLVIATDWAPPELRGYVEGGGNLLIAAARPPGLDVAAVAKQHESIQGYIRVRSAANLPSLKRTSLLMLDGPFTEIAGAAAASLTLVPPSQYAPPEKVHIDISETDIPALATRTLGKGRVIWLPWDAAALYHRHSLPAHGGLLADLVANLLPRGPQLQTNAHPLVEMSLMRQGNRSLLHLVNLSGHSVTAYHRPVPMTGIAITIAGEFARARALRSGATLSLRHEDSRASFELPQLDDYEVIVLE